MPYRRRFPLLLLAAVPLLATFPLAEVAQARGPGVPPKPAGEAWDAPAFSTDPAALLRAASKEKTGDGGVAVLLSESRFEYDGAGREVYTYHLVYRITDASADES